jgi:hypothetical protein
VAVPTADTVHPPRPSIFKLEMCLPINCEQQRQAHSSTSVEGGSMAMQAHAPIESASVWYMHALRSRRCSCSFSQSQMHHAYTLLISTACARLITKLNILVNKRHFCARVAYLGCGQC